MFGTHPDLLGLDSSTELRGDYVRLCVFEPSDSAGLAEALGSDPDVWTHIPSAPPDLSDWPRFFQAGVPTGRWPWIVRLARPLRSADSDLETGRVVGTTSYYDVSARDAHMSIGYTMYQRAVWGTAVNLECKLLLFGFAFGELEMKRVQLKTDLFNERSQAAIAALGATREGVLRKHLRRADGTLRDTVIYSLLADEWPAAKSKLIARLEART